MSQEKDLHLFIGLSRTVLSLHRLCDELFYAYNITRTQFGVMEAIYHKGPLRQCDVRELILTTPGNLPVVVKNLVRDGLVKTVVDEKDRRSRWLHLTKKGKSLMDEVFPKNAALLEEALSVWSEEEKEELRALFRAFRNRTQEGKETL